jgi:glycosyltransferase involved in cell wall biosynthesis
MPDNLPLVSIVTPSFRSARFIEETIRSIRDQSYPRIEYIVVDGGSEDGTSEIVARYPEVVSSFVTEPDDGQADAIRKGFEIATGDIFAWLNADDTYEQGTVEEAVGALTRFNADVAFGDMNLIDASGEKIGERRLSPIPSLGRLQGFISGTLGLYQPATFWTRELFDRVGGVDPSFQFAMDTDLFVRFAANGASFRYLDKVLVNFRVHADSKTSTMQDISVQDQARIIAKWPGKGIIYRQSIMAYDRLWKLAYHVARGRFRYLSNRYSDYGNRFVP